ncbi:hypothetical protein PISMIDRAFT_114521, partial [Pisolithus microcarpus 441]
MPWLKKFQPIINWKTHGIKGWKDVEPIPRAPHSEGTVRKTTISTDLKVKASTGKEEVILLDQYRDFAEVFSEKDIPFWVHAHVAKHLWCVTPDFPQQKRHIYPMSQDEMKSLRKFINENLKCGKIHESKSDQAAPVFFVRKKDGKHRLIQDY